VCWLVNRVQTVSNEFLRVLKMSLQSGEMTMFDDEYVADYLHSMMRSVAKCG
jgi:hypothetical protein